MWAHTHKDQAGVPGSLRLKDAGTWYHTHTHARTHTHTHTYIHTQTHMHTHMHTHTHTPGVGRYWAGRQADRDRNFKHSLPMSTKRI